MGWQGDGSLPDEEQLKLQWENEVERLRVPDRLQESTRRSKIGQIEQQIWTKVLQDAEIDEDEFQQAQEELGSIHEQLREELQKQTPAYNTDAPVKSIKEIIGEEVGVVNPGGWLSPIAYVPSIERDGGEEEIPIFNVELGSGDKETKIEGKVYARGTGDGIKEAKNHWSLLHVILYYQVTPPKAGILNVYQFPSLFGSFTIPHTVGYQTQARVTAGYSFQAVQSGEDVRPQYTQILEENTPYTFDSIDIIRDQVVHSVPVTDGQPVNLYFGIKMRAAATTDGARAELDFYEDWTSPEGMTRDQHIEVPPAYWRLDPS